MCSKKCNRYLSYQTVKLVQIDDPKLGLLHYVLMLLIFVYVIVWNVIGKNGYLSFEPPVGTVRMQLQAPTIDSDGHPCDPTDSGCMYNFTPVNKLSYCNTTSTVVARGDDVTSGASERFKAKSLPCYLLDELEVVYPVTGGSPFFVTTRVTDSYELNACEEPPSNTSNPPFNCPRTFAQANHTAYYTGDIERFTLLLDHAVRSPTVPSLQADSAQMDGALLGPNGLLTPHVTKEGIDFFTIGELLGAVEQAGGTFGYDLDGPSSVQGSSNSTRYDGMIMLLSIEYSNAKMWSGTTKEISYTYHVSVISGTKSKVQQQIITDWATPEASMEPRPSARISRDRHGIKIVVLQTGELGHFDANALLITLTTSLGLLALSTTLVDQLAIRVLRRKEVYKEAKIEVVGDEALHRSSFEHRRDSDIQRSDAPYGVLRGPP
jgi:hypothetical protein